MIRALLIFLFFPTLCLGQLPELEWVSSTGGPNNCDSRGIHLDSEGNIFSVGSFFGDVDFDPSSEAGQLVWTSEAGFLQKLDSNGDFLWVKGFGFQEGGELTCISVDTDVDGNIYVAGDFFGVVDLDPGMEEEIVVSEEGERNAFVVKLNAEGEFIWQKSFLSDVGCNLYDMHISSVGNIYLAGAYQGTIDLNPGEEILETTSQDFTDGYLIQLDADGEYVNSFTLPNENASRVECVTTDNQGNLYLSGAFSSTVDFDPGDGVFELTSAGGSDVFVSKISASGSLEWAKHFGGESTDNVKDLVVDGLGAVITTGYFRQTADFDPGENNFDIQAAGVSGQPDGFVHKLDSQGNFVWAYAYGGVSYDEGNGLVVDVFNDVYMNGRYAATADFLPGDEVLEFDSPGASDGFLLGLNGTDGSLKYITVLGATGGGRMGELDVDHTGALFVSGRFGGIADFDPSDENSSNTSAVSISDHFNWKVSQCILDTVITLEDGTLIASEIPEANYQWFTCDDPPTPIEGALASNFTPEDDGFYFVEIELGSCIVPSECLEVSSLSVEESAMAETVKVFPNPANRVVHFRGEGIRLAEFYDMTGKMIMTSTERDVDISSLKTGIYLVRIQQSDRTLMKRLVVAR